MLNVWSIDCTSVVIIDYKTAQVYSLMWVATKSSNRDPTPGASALGVIGAFDKKHWTALKYSSLSSLLSVRLGKLVQYLCFFTQPLARHCGQSYHSLRTIGLSQAATARVCDGTTALLPYGAVSVAVDRARAPKRREAAPHFPSLAMSQLVMKQLASLDR